METQKYARSVTLDIFCDQELRQTVLNSIRRYRAACRQLFAVLGCAQAAGGAILATDEDVSIRPDSAQAQTIMRQVFHLPDDAPAKALGYPCRRWFLDELYPAALSFVWDSARRQVVTRWQAKDPEFTRASRGWLVLQGARGVAEFRGVGIELPQATARPRLERKQVVLKWDRNMGPVEFKLGSMDPGRWFTWSNIVSGVWPPGTVTLNERDGRLRLTVSYERPHQQADMDPSRSLTLQIENDHFVVTGPDGELDTIGLADALAMLERLSKQRQLWEGRKECAGSPRRPWGDKKAWRATVEHLSRVTLNRERFVNDRNHAWTRRIATRATSWRCGVVRVPAWDGLGSYPWNWSQFQSFLRYKLEERGGSLIIEPKP